MLPRESIVQKISYIELAVIAMVDLLATVLF